MSTAEGRTLEWLLEEEEPSIRYRTLTDLLGRPPTDPEVRRARSEIPQRGWAAGILAAQRPDGRWTDSARLYTPKYHSTNWMLLLLAELGLRRDDRRIAVACGGWTQSLQGPDGGFSPTEGGVSHLCTTGNAVRALLQFGYESDPRVRKGLRWMIDRQAKLGGWSCFGSGRNLDSWEPLSAFAAYPRPKWDADLTEAVGRGAEFFLSRELHLQGAHYEPWYRFHSPVHYYYDLLVGLDVLTALGYGSDRRLRHAIEVVERKRGRDGRWRLDAVHPDVEGPIRAWMDAHPKQAPTPFALETVGRPSKRITLTAMVALARAHGTI